MENKKNDYAVIKESEASLVPENLLNKRQLSILLQETPKQYIHKRPAKGGGQWDYVTAGYVRKVLNLMFGWNWSFEVLERFVEHGEAVVLGKLTCKLPSGDTIVKTQFGNKEIICKRGTSTPLSIGNDYKSATSDSLKKCAAELGVAADVYNKMDFRPVKIVDDLTKEEKESMDRFLQALNKVSNIDELQMLREVYDNISHLEIFAKKYTEKERSLV